MLYLKSASSNLLTCKVLFKNKITLKLGPKIPHLGIFGLQFNQKYYQVFNQHPQISATINFHSKPKKINLWTKKLYLCLLAWKLKNNCHVCNQHSPIFLIAKFHVKIIILKFRTKNALFRWFGQQFWKIIVIFAISALEFVLMQSLVQKLNILKFETKHPLFGIFWVEIWKWYCYKCLICVFLTKKASCWYFCVRIFKKLLPDLKSVPSSLSNKKFGEKTKMPKFGTKNAWFGYIGAGRWKWYCCIWNQHPRICVIEKIGEKVKMPKFGTKNVLFGYFWAGILKQYCHIWNQYPRACPIAKFCEKMRCLGIFGLELGTILSYFRSAHSNLPNCKISWNNKNA